MPTDPLEKLGLCLSTFWSTWRQQEPTRQNSCVRPCTRCFKRFLYMKTQAYDLMDSSKNFRKDTWSTFIFVFFFSNLFISLLYTSQETCRFPRQHTESWHQETQSTNRQHPINDWLVTLCEQGIRWWTEFTLEITDHANIPQSRCCAVDKL